MVCVKLAAAIRCHSAMLPLCYAVMLPLCYAATLPLCYAAMLLYDACNAYLGLIYYLFLYKQSSSAQLMLSASFLAALKTLQSEGKVFG